MQMKLWLDNGLIPGTVLNKAEKGNLTGMAFLDNIYFVSSGVMLTQIRDISGIDGSTLQNWTKITLPLSNLQDLFKLSEPQFLRLKMDKVPLQISDGLVG